VAKLGIDIGGSFIKGLVYNELGAGAEAILHTQTIATPNTGVQPICAAITKLAKLLLQYCVSNGIPEPTSLGVGVPGVVQEGIVFHPPNLHGWLTVPLQEMLSVQSSLHVLVENDANCAAIAECQAGIGTQFGHFFVVTLGTGVGGCIVHQNRVWKGASGAGELGHMIVQHGIAPYPQQLPWQVGTVESAVGSAALLRECHNLNIPVASVAQLLQQASQTSSEYHQQATSVLYQATSTLSSGIASALALLGFTNVVLGGGIVDGFPTIVSWLQNLLQEQTMPHIAKVLHVQTSTFGNNSGAVGAALLEQYYQQYPQT
jgi:glucokinase